VGILSLYTMWIALVPPPVFAGMVYALVHLCTCCTSDPTTIVPGSPAAKSPPPLPAWFGCGVCLFLFLCVFCVLSGSGVAFGAPVSLFCSGVSAPCSLCVRLVLFLLLRLLFLLYLHVLLRTDCQITILELQVYCDVVLPCTACHPLTIATQASTRTKAAVQVRGSTQFRSPLPLMIFSFTC